MTAPSRPPLSPAAQAVMVAATMGNPNVINDPVYRQCIAAALRTAADQVVPDEQRPPRRGVRPGGTGALTPEEGAQEQRAATRCHLIRIATELDPQPTSTNHPTNETP